MKALAKDPAQRFADIQAFATALEQAGTTENTPTIYAFSVPQPLDMTVAVQFTLPQSAEETVSTGEPGIPWHFPPRYRVWIDRVGGFRRAGRRDCLVKQENSITCLNLYQYFAYPCSAETPGNLSNVRL